MTGAPFPFGLPLPSALYAVLLSLTFAVHLLAAQFLLAGSAYLAWTGLRSPGASSPLRALLVDWLPFGMGVTITLGVAPLLFLQIVDRQRFYSANLLLFHRWMAVLPVLIAAFYLLYLQKASVGLAGHRVAGRLIPATVFVCVAFVGFSWTENHLLSGQPGVWPGFYGSGARFFWTPELWPRFGAMLAAAFPGLAVVGSALASALPGPDRALAVRSLRGLALLGLPVAVLLGLVTFLSMDSSPRLAFALPWLALLALGLIATGATVVTSPGPSPRLAAAWSATLIALSFLRETVRWSRFEPDEVIPHHQRAFGVGGIWAFLLFAVLTGLLLMYCFHRVRQDLRGGPE